MRVLIDRFRRSGWLTFIVVWVGLTLASVSWALATPLGGSPDEPSHIIKASAVAHGQLLGTQTETPGTLIVQVPVGVSGAQAWPCYKFLVNTTANCAEPIIEGDGLTDAYTSAGLYNPVYYAAVGWPSLLTDDTRHGVFGMRAMSALISSFFLAVAFCALLQFRRPIVTSVAFLAAMTPMVFFLNGSVNPNSVEIAAGCALLSVLLAVVRLPQLRHQRLQLALVVVSGLFLANARGLSPLWMAFIAIVCLIFASPDRLRTLFVLPRVWVTVVLLGLSVAGAGLWVLRTNTLSAMGSYPGAGSTLPIEAFVTMLVDKSFDEGTIGILGWLEVDLPNFIPYLWSALFFGLVISALAVARGRLLAALLVMVGALFLVPPITQAFAVDGSGYIWQGRYSLIAYACVILLSGVVLAFSAPPIGAWLTRRMVLRGVVLVAVLIVGGQVLAILSSVRRYAIGVDIEWLRLVDDQQWAPPGGLFLWPSVALAGMLLVVGAIAAHTWSSLPARAVAQPPQDDVSQLRDVAARGDRKTQYLNAK